jgi:hypothetical protein
VLRENKSSSNGESWTPLQKASKLDQAQIAHAQNRELKELLVKIHACKNEIWTNRKKQALNVHVQQQEMSIMA